MKPLTTTTQKGWLIELYNSIDKVWVPVSTNPVHKLRAKSAARVWRKEHKMRARIVQTQIVTTTLAIEEHA